MRFLLQLGLKKLPDLSDVPLVLDMAKSAEDRAALELVFSRNALAYPFAAPPRIPEVRVRQLQAAFDQALSDPEVRADAAKQNLQWDPTLSGEMGSILERLTRTPGDVIARVRRALEAGEEAAVRR